MMLTFEEHVKKYELDEYEQEILAASEAGLLKEDEHSAERIAALQQAAHETMEEIRAKRAANATKPITLRVPVRVIERYKRKASASGIKYQTLMNEILDAAPV